MKTLEGILAKHPFFEGLEPRYMELLTGCASNMRFKAGDIIFREGEAAQQFFVIREGMVRLEVYAPGQGEVIPALSLALHRPRNRPAAGHCAGWRMPAWEV
jgi:CRP-like cAMP-binding protein